ncbi:phytanoyl-CoA dioxygenase family protein [Flavobacterium amniphilum]|uniref:phytanoyl-CoA dioxygenase family protein n=1 Tax=Flavobacterium amniphilum TaxID=1834035 RepID=UPI00202AC234|nr:phytanoyl-CoA dioxygenase family protein [Flavobacterium amniphilum]MCL9804234.1 phytanoyl-CoA dioxygenase family protein [Flavobacterium amniphilum]
MQHYLENLWKRTIKKETDLSSAWDQEIEILYRYNISLENALQYLHFENPDLNTFLLWVTQHDSKNNAAGDLQTENTLSDADMRFWNQNGYILIKNAIPKENCLATQKAIWDFLEMNPNEQETWYQPHPQQSGMMVNFSDHPLLNKNRESQKIRRAYEQLYQTTELFKTIDKVSFNAPVNEHHTFKGSGLHWDVSLQLPIPEGFQGLLYLSDCEAHEGAFHCVPGFHNRINEWLTKLQPTPSPREEAVKQLTPELVPITGEAGDFIIWHQTLPHCATANHGQSPRMVQYLTYFPKNYKANELWL